MLNYYLKDETYTKSAIDELLRNVGAGLSIKIVATLPTKDISGTTIYLINTTGSQYNQYMYIDSAWANLGSTSADLSSYYNKSQIDNILLGYVSASALMAQLMFYTKTSDMAKVAKTNDYNDLDNLPNIPDVSGIKPYSTVLQDSDLTAPTSKVVYDAVDTINDKIADLIDDTSTHSDKVYSSDKVESLLSGYVQMGDYVKVVEVISESVSLRSQGITSVSFTISDIEGYKPIYMSYMYTENYGNVLPSRSSNIITSERTSRLNMYNFSSSEVTTKVHATVMYIKV